MPVETLTEDARWAETLPALADRAIGAALGHMGLAPDSVEIAVLGCDDARIAALNADFRGKPVPTNVLSWPAFDLAPDLPGTRPDPVHVAPEEVPLFLGDIALAFDTCTREAEAAGKPTADHATHLLVHATLHLLGYDHIHDMDSVIMEAEEIKILGKMGLTNPYI